MPLKQAEIRWVLNSPADAIVKQALCNVYAQQQISIDLRVMLADWITTNAEVWFRVSGEMLPSEALAFLQSGAEFLEQKLQCTENEVYRDKRSISSHISYIRDICSGKPFQAGNNSAQPPIIITPALFLCRLKLCLLEETRYFETRYQQDDIDGAVVNLVATSAILGQNLDIFVKILEDILKLTPDNMTAIQQQQQLWDKRQRQLASIGNAIKDYTDAQKRAATALLSYRSRFNRQMAREAFCEKMTLYLDQLQAAYDTAAQTAMRDVARLQMMMMFSRHVGDEETALQLQTTANDVFTFLCTNLVSNCLVLERQMPQIVRKGAKFAVTPQLRMLCPSVLFASSNGSSVAQSPTTPTFEGNSTPVTAKFLGGFAMSQQQQLAIDSMVERRVAHLQQQQQQQQMQGRLQGGLGSGHGGASGRSVKSHNSNSLTGLVSANVDVDVYFLSETQAQEFVKTLVLPKPNTGAMIHSAQLTLDRTSKQCGAVFKALSLSNFSRGDRKHSQLVTEEKFCLAFTCGIPLRAMVQLDSQQLTTVLASCLSLPVVVTVHNSQEANAAIATLWDNYFAELNRLPFEVPRKALWSDVKQLLNGKWKAACSGQGLTEQNLAYLADRLLQGNRRPGQQQQLALVSSNFDNETVTWAMLAKDPLPCHNADLPRFTFWDWFHSCLKLMTKDCLYSFWPDYLIGFASHEQVEEMLKDCEPGTFLLRFSSTELGACVIPYVKNHKSGGKVVERGYGPCTFKECEPCKVISDLKPLRYFYPSMRAKHDVLREIEEGGNTGGRKKKHRSESRGYEKLEQKTVGASSSSEGTEDEGASVDNSAEDSMNCDVMSNTPQSCSPGAPLSTMQNEESSVTLSTNAVHTPSVQRGGLCGNGGLLAMNNFILPSSAAGQQQQQQQQFSVDHQLSQPNQSGFTAFSAFSSTVSGAPSSLSNYFGNGGGQLQTIGINNNLAAGINGKNDTSNNIPVMNGQSAASGGYATGLSGGMF